jgi:hypothetical protein
MSAEDPTIKDLWRLLGTMNKRFGERFDNMERQFVGLREEYASLRAEVGELRGEMRSEISALGARMTAGFGALKESIEARDFRLDEHGRRLTELEGSGPIR